MDGVPTVSVLLPLAVDGPYTYRVPNGVTLSPGDIVRVPLGPREIIGAVWDDVPDGSVGHNRLRPVAHRYDAPPLDPTIRKFVDWVANYTLTPRGMVLRMVLRAPGALEAEHDIEAVMLSGKPPERMTNARRRVLEQAGDGAPWSRSALAAAAGVSPGVVSGLVEQGSLTLVHLPPAPVALPPDPDHAPPRFDDGQSEAAAEMRRIADAGLFGVTLIDGITGSGKTEVYFEAVAETLRRGRQALILLPEIALTTDFLDRFARRFGERPAEWHSEVPPRQRERTWRAVAAGTVKAVVGARSALFLPFPELGLVIVDEEHDSAYKQEEGVTYNARDMAVVRGHLGSFPDRALLGDAVHRKPGQRRPGPLSADRAHIPLRRRQAARDPRRRPAGPSRRSAASSSRPCWCRRWRRRWRPNRSRSCS